MPAARRSPLEIRQLVDSVAPRRKEDALRHEREGHDQEAGLEEATQPERVQSGMIPRGAEPKNRDDAGEARERDRQVRRLGRESLCPA